MPTDEGGEGRTGGREEGPVMARNGEQVAVSVSRRVGLAQCRDREGCSVPTLRGLLSTALDLKQSPAAGGAGFCVGCLVVAGSVAGVGAVVGAVGILL